MGEFALMTLSDLICKADNFGDIPFDSLDRDIPYIFELVRLFNKVVVPYETTSLYHIGTCHNLTGR